MITQQESRDITEKKIEEVKALAKKLQIQIIAKQIITPQNTIELAVFYIDHEKRDVEPAKSVVRGPLPVMTPRAKALADKKGGTGKEEKEEKGPNVQSDDSNALSPNENTIPQ